MCMLLTIVTIILILWILAHLKTSRPDGALLTNIHPYRRLMSYIMPKRNESIVYFDIYVPADKLLSYLKAAKEKIDIDITHCLVAACGMMMIKNPQINRFISGRRLYQREKVAVTFSMMRKKLDKKSKLTAVKLEVDKNATFKELCETIHSKINYERSNVKTSADKEFNLLNLLPRPLLNLAINFAKLLDYFNLLPANFIKNDGMFTGMFVANLGSLGIDAGYHHLYEWGNCSSFCMASKIYDRPVLKEGKYVPQKILHLRFTFDERIENGYNAKDGAQTITEVLEDPYRYLGCLSDDKKGHRTFHESLFQDVK